MNGRFLIFALASLALNTCGKSGGGGGADPVSPDANSSQSPNGSGKGSKTKKELRFDMSLADVKGEGSTIYAATSFNGLHISRDDGATWAVKGDKEGLMDSGLAGLRVTPEKVYLLSSRALSVSSDHGNTWKKRALPDSVNNPFNNGKFCVDSGTVYMLVEHGLAMSSDDGATWSVKKSPEIYNFQTGLNGVYARGTRVYVATNRGLMISNDKGQTWAEKTESDFGPKMTKTGLSAVWGDGKTMFAAADNLYVSADDGKTWAYKSNIPNTDWAADFSLVDGKLYVIGAGLASSTDGGGHWEPSPLVDSDGSPRYVKGIHIFGNTMYAVPKDHGGLYRTRDSGKTWEAL